MPEDDARKPKPGRPKLRTSCDECGAAKLRCDRGQPECGRCISRGMSCVYGVSRKMGKPPRHKLRSSPAQGPVDQVTGTKPCDAADDMIDLDGPFDQSTLPLSAFTEFTDWTSVDPFDATLFPNTPESFTTHFTTQPTRPSMSLPAVDEISMHQDCSRKAYGMLGKLSLFDDQSPEIGFNADGVPFDQVLCLTREVSEQLSKLLACACAPCPTVVFVKASIISKILSWYHQSAASMHVATSQALSTASSPITPAAIAVGTFNVDDERVQAALKIQLLLGEMRRVGLLIDQFALHGTTSTFQDDQPAPDTVDKLYQHLTTWLRGEHSRIALTMKSRLRELNS